MAYTNYLCIFKRNTRERQRIQLTCRILSSTDPADLTSVNYLLRVFMYFVVMFTTWTLAIFGYLATDSKYFRACLMWVRRPGKTWWVRWVRNWNGSDSAKQITTDAASIIARNLSTANYAFQSSLEGSVSASTWIWIFIVCQYLSYSIHV